MGAKTTAKRKSPSASPSLSPPSGSRRKKIYEDMKYSKGPEEAAASAEARERNYRRKKFSLLSLVLSFPGAPPPTKEGENQLSRGCSRVLLRLQGLISGKAKERGGGGPTQSGKGHFDEVASYPKLGDNNGVISFRLRRRRGLPSRVRIRRGGKELGDRFWMNGDLA